MLRPILLTLVAISICACATPQTRAPDLAESAIAQEAHQQKIFVIQQRAAELQRVADIHWRISAANVEFCRSKASSIGIGVHSLARYGRSVRDAARHAGLSNEPTVAFVLQGSPAETAGVKAGDVIVAIGGKRFPHNAQGLRSAARTIEDAQADAPLTIELRRNGVTETVIPEPIQVCGYGFQVVESDEINAFADGRNILLPRGMLRFVQNDKELAFIIGHEVAHNAAGHLRAKAQNQALGMAGGLLIDVLVAAATGYADTTFMEAGAQIGAAAYSQEFETEADYIGMYFMARAGFALDGVEMVWRRLAAESGGTSIVNGSSHPPTAQRFVAIAAVRDEILRKQASGEPLTPRMKADQPPTAETPPVN